MTAWIGVASAEHVARGVALGIAQIGHGKRPGLARMRPGDTLVYYSPVHRLGDTAKLREFTAIGRVDEGEIWQADEGDFRPFRRAVTYRSARPVAVADLRGRLALTAEPNWGYQLRRGLVEIAQADADVIEHAMIER
ncbi:EVE domain-containing protein [Microbacterium sp. VKM Ac-2923]|uniref:EVE domain-containing protein n=1 Tax=Microbacterium sp. VKM Ac-2923 TaxID=2929476 RepID=UPI001FB568EF|nr:EVE domain-containing protein [Microbacterium sp. VKM Ac-2923]MCJ1706135.1 EVE domain-containing protein [Microbacterium sp. VKM Ac-2923]